MNRITSSSGRSGEVLDAAPMSEPRRTLALCLACLVPAGLALLGAGYVFVFWMVDPPVHTENWGEFSNAELAAVMACGVLAALGGSLLGVVTARWWRWPTAAAVTAVLLIIWTFVGLINDTNAAVDPQPPGRAVHAGLLERRRLVVAPRWQLAVAGSLPRRALRAGSDRGLRARERRRAAPSSRCAGRSRSASSPWPCC